MVAIIDKSGQPWARPERLVPREGQLWGLFPAEEECQHDEWLCWGPDTPGNRALAAAGAVPIEESP